MSYTICQPDLDQDRAAILGLWKRNLPGASPDRYAWLYQTGPATGWLLKAEGGLVVGAAGLMDRRMHVFGSRVRAGQAIDLNVDQHHRTMGPALGLGRAVTATVSRRQYALIYGLPIAQSEPVLRRAGYQVLGEMRRWAKPLCCRDVLARWLRPALPRNAAAAAINPLLHLASAETYYRRPADVRVEVTDHFDRRFDVLWEAAAAQFQVVGERTSAYLTWRFCRCPEVRHRTLCLLGAGGELLAYLIFCRREGTVHVGDFLFADVGKLDVLLAEFLRLMRREKAKAVTTVYLGPEVVCRKFRRFGFWQRPSPWKALICVDQQRFGPESARLRDTENWYLTRADLDTDG
jgi:hypothetical protein